MSYWVVVSNVALSNAKDNSIRTMNSVSVVIPCFNAREWIGETLRSVLHGTQQPLEVIVVDDGSTDGSSEFIQSQFPEVRVTVTLNRGVSHARNLGIKISSGRYLVFLDADDVLLPGTIARQVAVLEKTKADVAYGNWQWLRPGPNGTFQPAERVERAMACPPEIDLLGVFWCPTGAYLFRRSIVERVGGFNTGLPVVEDARFALDCALHGGTFVHDPCITCLYRTHTGVSLSTRSALVFYKTCLTNALEVRDGWQQRGCLTSDRLTAVLQVLDNVALSTALLDQETFITACHEVVMYQDVQAPSRTPFGQLLNRLLGYQRARALVARIRNWLPLQSWSSSKDGFRRFPRA